MIKAQFERAKADIVNAQRQGLWSQVELKESFVVKDARGQDRLLCISLAVVPKDGPATKDSVLCVGSVNNKFLKFRLTTNQHAGSQNETRRFLDAWMSLLWPLSERQL